MIRKFRAIDFMESQLQAIKLKNTNQNYLSIQSLITNKNTVPN